jgi:hypothetical protein
MIVTMHVRTSLDGPLHIVSTDGTADDCMAYLKGFLCVGYTIVEHFDVIGK